MSGSVIISKIINSNDIFYQNNCLAPTRDEINDGEDSHEIFSIDGDHFLLLLCTIKNQENFIQFTKIYVLYSLYMFSPFPSYSIFIISDLQIEFTQALYFYHHCAICIF